MSVVKERYAAYKESGVEWLGKIPEHWTQQRHKDCFHLVSSRCTNTSLTKVGLENIKSKTGCFIPTNGDFDGNGIEFRKNDILFGKLRPYLAKVYRAKFNGNAVGDIFVYRSKLRVASEFATYLMRSDRYIDVINSSTTGAKMPRVSSGFIANLPVAIPPLPEQTAIAAFLDRKTGQIDRKIVLLSQKAMQYGKLKQSLITETVTRGLDKTVPMYDSGVEWIGEVPEHWEMQPIRNLLENKSNKNIGNTEAEYLSLVAGVGVIPYAEKGNIGNKQSDNLEKCKMVFKGDFVLNSMNFGIGSFGLSRYNGVCSSVYIVMRPKIISNGEFLHRIFQVKPFQKLISSFGKGIMDIRMAIKWEHLKNIEIPCPPLDEQTAIATYLDEKIAKIDHIVTSINNQIDKLKELRKTLINDVVTGKIKVISEDQTV